VTRRRDALDELEGFDVAARREAAARDVSIDPAMVWGDPTASSNEPAGAVEAEADDEAQAEAQVDALAEADDEEAPSDAIVDPDAERQDAWARRFAPAGVFLRGLVDERHWLTAGAGPELPVLVSGSTVLLSRDPVSTPVRLAEQERLRLSGLLWPEAAERLANSAWATVERRGNGQVVLLADVPGFRGQFLSGARLFANAVIYGPGLGARQPVGW
jgi:hypothetical protein